MICKIDKVRSSRICMHTEINYKAIRIIALIFAAIFWILYGLGISYQIIGGVYLLIISAMQVVRMKNNKILFLLFFMIAYFNYSIVVANYFIPSMRVNLHGVADVEKYYNTALIGLILFASSLFYFVRTPKKGVTSIYIKNQVLFTLFFLITTGITLFINEERIGGNSLLIILSEYKIIVFILACLFCGGKKKNIYALFILMMLFSIKEFLNGGRILSIQCILVFFFFFLARKFSIKAIIACCILGILGLNFIGQIRSGGTIGDFLDAFTSIFKSYLVFDTVNFAFNASISHIATFTEIVSVGFRIQSLLVFIVSIVFGNSLINTDIAILTTYSSQYFYNLGGGIITSYAQFWLGNVGVILMALIVAKLCNSITNPKSILPYLISVTFASTIFRWYLYSPLQIFRMAIFFILVCYFFIYLYYAILGRKPIVVRTGSIKVKVRKYE